MLLASVKSLTFAIFLTYTSYQGLGLLGASFATSLHAHNGLLHAVYLCNDLDAYSEKVLGSSIVDCFWAVVGHGIVAHQHKIVLCVCMVCVCVCLCACMCVHVHVHVGEL